MAVQALMGSGSEFYTDRYFAHANQMGSQCEPSLNWKKAGLCSESSVTALQQADEYYMIPILQMRSLKHREAK